ncbi:hypothetical protein [Candidatus Parabeggiatoa sp. HSG14]|uniref:hypothetical protein n=1 Tax=Candidatus Parabeggiatoa sp. HSG14 TaxID=3055593 RepID=UPI0025A77CD0|nr:hypothetical protein [Thiotrichales bacterium HSG14]
MKYNALQKTRMMLVVWLLVLSHFSFMSNVHAADDTKSQVVIDLASPVIDSIEDVKKVSKSLIENFDKVMVDIEKSLKSTEEAERKFDETTSLVKKVLSLFDEDSKMWEKITQGINKFSNKVKRAREKEQQQRIKGENADQWKEIAQEWLKRKSEMEGSQQELLSIKQGIETLLENLPSQRELIIEYIELEFADKALAGVKSFVDEMQSIKVGLEKIIGTLKTVSGGKSPQ